MSAAKPTLVERLEELAACLDEAREAVLKPQIDANDVQSWIENASGIAGEILTMVDGR